MNFKDTYSPSKIKEQKEKEIKGQNQKFESRVPK